MIQGIQTNPALPFGERQGDAQSIPSLREDTSLQVQARDIYAGSDGELTKRFYARLEDRGHIGIVAVNLFRAQKCSARAKVYRGGVRGYGSFKRLAYDRKAWALRNLCSVLEQHGNDLNIRFGWKEDPLEYFASWVLYVDLPNGQVSFHNISRLAGPDYPGQWDGQHLSCNRVLDFCDAVLDGGTVVPALQQSCGQQGSLF